MRDMIDVFALMLAALAAFLFGAMVSEDQVLESGVLICVLSLCVSFYLFVLRKNEEQY